jgi:hypothetical protein
LLTSLFSVAARDNLKTTLVTQMFVVLAHPFFQRSTIRLISPDDAQAWELPTATRKQSLCSQGVMHMSGRDNELEHQALRFNEQVTLAAIDLLETVIAAGPPFSLVLTLWLSITGLPR